MSGSKLTVGDFNGDKKSDVAILYGYAAQREVKAFVLSSNGTAFNAPQTWWDSGPGNWDWAGTKLQSGDFNGDKKDDLVAFYGYAKEHQTRAFVFTAGSGGFNLPAVWWDSGPGNWDWVGSKLAAGDFNGDNKDDLAVLYGYSGAQTRLWMFLGADNKFNRPGKWWDSGPGKWDWARTKFVAGNYNGDNKSDLSGLY